MIISRVVVLGLASVVVSAIVACGGAEPTSTFDPNHPPDLGGGGGGGGGIGDLGDGGGPVNATCATESAKAQQVPVNLVFMFDRSGSMAENAKWDTCKAGLNAFFSDPKSAGMSASIQFFANLQNECSVASYSNPAVALSPLPDGARFKAVIDTFSPNAGTPTLPALKGAIAYAQQIQATHPGEKVAVVLATDGIPNDCNSTVANVSAAAKAASATVPTYVIGVGDALQSLDQIAQGGGTNKAFVVAVGNPAQTATDFQTALSVIRGNSLSCEYKMPAPPPGKTLDINTLNVQFTPSHGGAVTLTYNKDCSGSGDGWHYDDVANPQKIEICKTSCDFIQKDSAGKIDIVTGCATKGGVTR